MKINFFVNAKRADGVQSAREASRYLIGRGVDVCADRNSFEAVGVPLAENAQFADCDLAVTFGGDGTLINAAHLCADKGTPILGVYYGRFGFVTQCMGDNVIEVLDRFIAGKTALEHRMMLQTELIRGGKSIAAIQSLNETVVQRGVTVRMLLFRVQVDGHDLTTYPADGILISTATGSTAYNLSAGGPIMDPRVEAIVLTAIAPHTLSSRSLVLHHDSVIQLSMETDGEAVLSADGLTRLHLLTGDQLIVKRSALTTKLVIVNSDDFLLKLGKRLFWSQGFVKEPPTS